MAVTAASVAAVAAASSSSDNYLDLDKELVRSLTPPDGGSMRLLGAGARRPAVEAEEAMEEEEGATSRTRA